MFIQNDLTIDSRLTDLYKKQIINKSLIKTGNLLNSISLSLIMDYDGSTDIIISALYYLQYLDNDYSITNDFIDDIETMDIISNVISEYTLYYIDNEEDLVLGNNIEIKLIYDFVV
jgi:hypothetical protein